MADNISQDNTSLDDILTSIRRIMAEEDSSTPAVFSPPTTSIHTPSQHARPNDGPRRPAVRQATNTPPPAVLPEYTAPPASPTAGILSFLKDRIGATPPPTPSSQRPSTPAPTAKQPAKSAATPRPSTSLEAVVIEALRPVLKEWMNQNLAPLVESVVQREVQKMLQAQKASKNN